MTRLPRIVFPILICLVAVAAVFAPHGLVPLGAIAAITLAADANTRGRFIALLRRPLMLGFGGLILWAAVSSLWSPHPLPGILLALQVAAVMAAGAMLAAGIDRLDGEARDRALTALALAGPIFLLLTIMELLSGGAIAKTVHDKWHVVRINPAIYDRAAAIGAILAWPIAYTLWLRVRPIAAILFLVILLAILFQLEMAAARLAFVIGGVVFAISYWTPRIAIRGMLVVLLAAILALPPALIATGAGDAFPALAAKLPEQETSSQHRLYIAQFVLNKIADRPIIGYGFDSSRALPGGQAPSVAGEPTLPLHPHDGILQVWLELGAVGAVIAAFIVSAVLFAVNRLAPQRGPAAMASATFATFFTIAVLSYGIWQNWWLMTAWIAAAVAVLAAKAQPD